MSAFLPRWYAESASQTYVTERDLPAKLRLLRWLGHQTWIPRGQDRLLRALCNPDRCDNFFFDVDFFGQRYRGNLAHYIDWTVFCYGSAATDELSLLHDIVTHLKHNGQPAPSYFDVGANAGHHTLYMAPRVGRVVAFEPFEVLRRLIQQKIDVNGLTNVQLLPFALGEQDETAHYYPGSASNSGTGSLLSARTATPGTSIDVDVRNGDRLIDQLGLPKIDILKIDVEGFEGSVLRGLSAHIKRDQPFMLMELIGESRRGIGNEQDFRNLIYPNAVIATVGGRLGKRYSLRPFDYDTAFEILVVPETAADFIASRLS